MKKPLFLALILASPVAFSPVPSALAAPETQNTGDLKAAITKAIETNNVAKAQKLIANSALDLTAPLEVYHSRPALLFAAGEGRTAIFKAMLARPGLNPNLQSSDGENAIGLVAGRADSLEMLKALVANPKADLNLTSSYSKDTPLMQAAYGANIEGVKLLLASPRVNVTRKNTLQQSALHRAAQSGSPSTVKLLMATKKFDINALTQYKDTPLHYAASSGDAAVIKALLSDPKINPNLKNSDNDTPLSIAATRDMRYVQALMTSKKVLVTSANKKAIAKLKKQGGRAIDSGAG